MNSENIKNITNQAIEQLIETLKAGKSEAAEFAVEADGNGRDRSPFTWRDRVQAQAAIVLF